MGVASPCLSERSNPKQGLPASSAERLQAKDAHRSEVPVLKPHLREQEGGGRFRHLGDC